MFSITEIITIQNYQLKIKHDKILIPSQSLRGAFRPPTAIHNKIFGSLGNQGSYNTYWFLSHLSTFRIQPMPQIFRPWTEC